MFDFQQPIRHDAKRDLTHGIVGGLGLTLVLLAAAFEPHAIGRLGFLRRHLVFEWGPVMFVMLGAHLRASTPATAAALALAFGGAILGTLTNQLAPPIVGSLIGGYLLMSVQVANQWEKCVVLRFGNYYALRGPGIFRIVPFIDRVAAFVDERVRTTDVHAEAALTRDAVPVHVDAVIFWVVWDVEKAVLEVQDFDRIVGLIAQTALLESIGRHHQGHMIAERGALGKDLQRILEEKTTPWGITLQSVDIRDVHLPGGLQDAMSRQAQAERERQARVIFGDTEVDLADKFAQASEAYRGDPTALHLRAMNMLFEAIKEKGTMVVVPTGGLTRRTGRTKRSQKSEVRSQKSEVRSQKGISRN